MTEDLARGYSRIIENYTIDNNFIHINYIDGQTEVKEMLEYNKEKIEQEMLEQAKKIIQDKTSYEFIETRKNGLVELTFTSAVMAMLASIGIEAAFGTIDEKRVVAELIGSLIVPVIVFSTIKGNQKKDDLEIKKYQLFIEHYEEFVSNQYSEKLYDGINKKGYLSINNLDSYTYEELNKMYDNIKNVRTRTNN
jgi:hypothetical protein